MKDVIYKFLDDFLLRLGRFEVEGLALDGVQRAAGLLHGRLVAILTRPPPSAVYQVLVITII